MLAEEAVQKWTSVLDHGDLSPIKDPIKRKITAMMMENTQRELGVSAQNGGSYNLLGEAAPTNSMLGSSSTEGTGGIDTFDPILISMVRRTMPNLMAYDIAGVQPMTGPTGLIFAYRSRYTSQSGNENFYNEVDTSFSNPNAMGNTTVNLPGYRNVGTLPGNTSVTSNLAETNTYNYSSGMTRSQAEGLGTSGNTAWPEMAFSIEKTTVEAKSRALKAEYSMEIAQDLKAIHGLEVESELSNMLSVELLAEINREVVRTINVTAVPGSQTDTATPGVYDLDTDSNGRWSVERFKGLMFQLARESNVIAKQTRRGKGNIVICSADVASALQMAGVLDYAPALNSNNLQVDDTGNTFVGVLNGTMKVYIDPYAIGGNYMTVGYKGPGQMDAGIFYCPYVPLQMVRAVDPQSFQPKIGYKTRYGMVANPFAQGLTVGMGALVKDSNVFYRRSIVNSIA